MPPTDLPAPVESAKEPKLPQNYFELLVYVAFHPKAAWLLGALGFAAGTACQLGYNIPAMLGRTHIEANAEAAPHLHVHP